MERKNNYPFFFIHGFMGWGENDGIDKIVPYWGGFKMHLMDELRDRGYECYAPSLSGLQSAWDRACELWAIIYGGTVDYGKAHSEKYGHARYGRTYPGIMKDWGQPGDHEKMHIIGHSFGGPTALVFSGLLEGGDEEERKVTPKDELSPLFAGGHGDLLESVTTLSGVNNGTLFASFLRDLGVVIIDDLVLCAVTAVGNSLFTRVLDFNMDQWGVMDDPKTLKSGTGDRRLRSPFAKWKEIKRYDANPDIDSIGHEMQIEVMYKWNQRLPMAKNAYHFARRACRSHQIPGKDIHAINKDATIISKIPSKLTGQWSSPALENDTRYQFDRKTWFPNDGLVNVIGQNAPLNKPQTDWVEGTKPERGMWYNMPVEYKDHLSWMSYGEPADVYLNYNLDMVKMLSELD